MSDPAYDLWDFEDAAGSEARFRSAAEQSEEPLRSVLMTQVARALGLQQRYDEAHTVLDTVAPLGGEVEARVRLERGRVLRSAGQPEDSLPHFHAAAEVARLAGLEALEIDALHMVALVVAPEERIAASQMALVRARMATDQRARDWDASLLNNLGMEQADRGDWTAALAAFEEALSCRERIGDDARTRVARWMVGWALRNLGRIDEARGVQLALRADLEAAGEDDPYVTEELALLDQERT